MQNNTDSTIYLNNKGNKLIQPYIPHWVTTLEKAAESFKVPSKELQNVCYEIENVTFQKAVKTNYFPYQWIALTGIPHVGKTTIKKQLLKYGFSTFIHHTTRLRRPGEIEGIDSYFVTKDILQEMEKKGKFIAVTLHKHGMREKPYWSGLGKEQVLQTLDTQKYVIMEKQLKSSYEFKTKLKELGVKQENLGKILTIFILPPSLDILAERATKRALADTHSNDSSEEQKDRVLTALDRSFSEHGLILASLNHDDIVYIVNDDLERVIKKILNLYGIKKNLN